MVSRSKSNRAKIGAEVKAFLSWVNEDCWLGPYVNWISFLVNSVMGLMISEYPVIKRR